VTAPEGGEEKKGRGRLSVEVVGNAESTQEKNLAWVAEEERRRSARKPTPYSSRARSSRRGENRSGSGRGEKEREIKGETATSRKPSYQRGGRGWRRRGAARLWRKERRSFCTILS